MNWSAVGVLLEVDEPAGGRRGTEVLLFLLAQRHAATDTVRTSLLGNREGCRIVPSMATWAKRATAMGGIEDEDGEPIGGQHYDLQ
jgi:hypothetical protein